MADRRGLRQLLKRPRHIRRWPLAAYGLIGLLVAVIVLAVIGAAMVHPKEFPPAVTADQWAAEGAVFAAGAFLLAVLATAIATIAYINSTEEPSLRLTAEYPGRDEPLHVDWHTSAPAESGLVISSAQDANWSLAFRLHNDGPVAARFLAIHVIFGPGLQLYSAGAGQWLQPWRARSVLATETNEVWWEGGANAVVHPRWPYDVPQLGQTALRLAGPQSQTTFTFVVEVVADDTPPLRNTYTIRVPQDK